MPYRNESSYATLLVGCCSLFPCSILGNLEGTDGKKVTVLSVDGTNKFGDVGGLIAFHLGISGQGSPSGVNGELLVFAATIHSLIVLINHILSLLAVGLHDELLHLFHCKVHGDDFGDAEESRLENGVGAVAETDFLRNLGGVNIVNGNIMLGKVALHIVRQVGCEFFAFPDGVEKEGAVVAQTAKHVVHVEVSLHVTCHEVRGLDLIGGADGGITKTQVRAGETAGLLGVVGEVCLAILVSVVTDNLDGVLVGTNRTVCDFIRVIGEHRDPLPVLLGRGQRFRFNLQAKFLSLEVNILRCDEFTTTRNEARFIHRIGSRDALGVEHRDASREETTTIRA